MIAVTKKKAGGFLLGFTLSIITLGTIGLSFNTNTTFAKKEVLNKDIAISNVKNNYNTYVKTTKDTVLYDIERKNIGTLKKDTEIILDDNYNIITSLDGTRMYIDKENPRVEIEITKI